jgi:hypothetical protein
MDELAARLHQICAPAPAVDFTAQNPAGPRIDCLFAHIQVLAQFLLYVGCATFFNQENTNGKDRRRCNADAEG